MPPVSQALLLPVTLLMKACFPKKGTSRCDKQESFLQEEGRSGEEYRGEATAVS